MEDNIILGKAIILAKEIIIYARDLPPDTKVLGHHLVRAGTAIGALITEAQRPERRLDFIHKLKIADKEARET